MAILRRPAAAFAAISVLGWACTPVEVPMFDDNSPEEGQPPPAILDWDGTSEMGAGGASGQASMVSLLLDDFEDGDERGNEPFGWWYLVNDGSGVQEMEIVPADGLPVSGDLAAGLVLEVSSRDFRGWGAAWGVDISQMDESGSALELSFSIAASRNMEISFHAIDGSGDHFTREILLSPSWSRVVTRLDELLIVDSDGVRAFESSTATELQWFIFEEAAATIWVDDVLLRSW